VNQKIFDKEFINKDEKTTPNLAAAGKLHYNAPSLESKNSLNIVSYNINSKITNTKFDHNFKNKNNNSNSILNNLSNSINFIGGSNTNVINLSSGNVNSNSNFHINNTNNNFNMNNNNNAVYNKNSNNYVNFKYINSNPENSFVATKPVSGSAIIYKKNQELNFSTKITDSNSSLRDIIGVYSVNKKVN